MFLATSINTATTPQKQNGFRYTLTSSSDRVVAFDTRAPKGSFYDLAINGNIFVGGDTFYANDAEYWLQGARLYLNYFPDTVDEMINLAIMETGNIFHYSEHPDFSHVLRYTLHFSL